MSIQFSILSKADPQQVEREGVVCSHTEFLTLLAVLDRGLPAVREDLAAEEVQHLEPSPAKVLAWLDAFYAVHGEGADERFAGTITLLNAIFEAVRQQGGDAATRVPGSLAANKFSPEVRRFLGCTLLLRQAMSRAEWGALGDYLYFIVASMEPFVADNRHPEVARLGVSRAARILERMIGALDHTGSEQLLVFHGAPVAGGDAPG